MSLWKRYYIARDLTDALHALRAAQGSARLVAGGTDLLLDLQQGRHPPLDTLVDINQVAELHRLELDPEGLFVGAGITLSELAASGWVQQYAQALVEACRLVGGPQVRNLATLGGNVAHALPAADGSIALLALGATARVASLAGLRHVPLEALYLGPGRSALHPQEDILVGFLIPISASGIGAGRVPGERRGAGYSGAGYSAASAFRRVMRPQGVALPVLNMGVWVQRSGERLIDLRIALGPAGPVPQRGLAAEALLRGQDWSQELVEAAARALAESLPFRTSPHRATAAYRRHLAGVLLRDTLQAAWQRCR